ncbi:MAG: carboxypeptidase-like regulatory domain-containing protein, partial [Myxococcota bacterium]
MVEGVPNALLPLPRLQVAGVYTLTEVRLVRRSNGQLVLARNADAPTIAVEVIDELLVSQVTSRPLTLEEIEEAGIIITEDNFTAFEFSVGLTVGSEQVDIELPVVLPGPGIVEQTAASPAFPSLGAGAPTGFQTVAIPNLSVNGFVARAPPEIEDEFDIPPINGLIIIPGNIAFLNQFFSVLVVTLNTGPEGSGLVVQNARARARLPEGADGSLGTGDDPLGLARTNEFPDGIPDTQPLLDETGSDVLAPQRSHEAEFLVEGLREGTHPIQFDILGDLFVPALGETVPISGEATGVVQVRNPTFSITLAHPDVVREGEDYSIFATVTNTSSSPANLFEIGLNTRSLSGAFLADGADDRFALDQLLPGQAETFEFALTAGVTGEVTGTVFLADDSVNGAFILTTGVGDTGIPLSPDTLVLPSVVDFIPDDPDLVFAVVRMLGQAYSVATAPNGTLPPDIDRIRTDYVFNRGIKLAEVGLHARFGESALQGALDVYLDQIAGDLSTLEARFLTPVAGLDPTDPESARQIAEAQERYDAALADVLAYDSLRRAADAGQNLAQVIGLVLEDAVIQSSLSDVQMRAAEWFTSYPGGFLSYGASAAGVEIGLVDAVNNRVGFDESGTLVRELPLAEYVPVGTTGSSLVLASSPSSEIYTFSFSVPLGLTESESLSLTVPDGEGLSHLSYALDGTLPAGSTGRAMWALGADPASIVFEVDFDGDGVVDELLAPVVSPVVDTPPLVQGVFQWGEGSFPVNPPLFETGDPLGRLAAVLFSEPVSRASLSADGAFGLFTDEANSNDGIPSGAIVPQPDGRLVFVQFDEPFGPFVPRVMRIARVRDAAGLEMESVDVPVVPNPERGAGGRVRGRILRPDGTPVPLARVDYIQTVRCETCLFDRDQSVVVSSVYSDLDGNYELEFVLKNSVVRDFRLEVVDPATGNPGRTQTHIRFDGQDLRLDVIIRGFGSIVGRLLDENGDPIPGGAPGSPAALPVVARNLSTGESAVSYVDARGVYSFPSAVQNGSETLNVPALPVGNISLQVVRPSDGATALSTTNIPAAGVTVEQDLLLVDFNRFGSVAGRVVEADGVSGAPGVLVQIAADVLTDVVGGQRVFRRSVVAQTLSDESGRYRFDDIPTGDVDVRAFRQNTFESARAQSFLEDGQTRTLDLVFPGSGASVSGTVFDASGLPLANATV